MRNRIFFKLFAAFLVVIAAATAVLDFTIRRAWDDSLRTEITQSLTQKTELFAQRVQNDKSQPLSEMVKEEALAAGARTTIIDRTGKVLGDSQANPDEMENHATRPEFVAALSGHPGAASRRSHTVGIEFLYVAVPIPGGAVRMAYPLSSLQQTTSAVRREIFRASLLAVLLAMLLAGGLAHLTARRLTRMVEFAGRVAKGDLTARLDETSFDEIGQVAGALDATARKLEESFAALESSRNQLEALLDGIQDAVIGVSSEGRVRWANDSMSRLLGEKIYAGGLIVETIRDPDFLSVVRESLAMGEIRSGKASGIVLGRIFDVTVAPIPGGGAVAVLHDLSDIERVEKTRRDFIANVSHELRTPLTSVQGYAETLLETSALQDPTREFLEIIRKNAVRMSRLTDDLLTLARVESGEQRMEVQPVAASALLADALQSFRPIAAARGMQLIVRDADPGEVLADTDAVHQVFANLIDNAIKYAAGGGAIEIGSRAVEHGVEFFVQDFGPGIASEHQARIFERFYRVDKSRSAETGGTGLGLSIVKHIVLNHGGRVRLESNLNHGATFHFTLRRAMVASMAGHNS